MLEQRYRLSKPVPNGKYPKYCPTHMEGPLVVGFVVVVAATSSAVGYTSYELNVWHGLPNAQEGGNMYTKCC
jgi:hypothetical protein